MHADWRVEWTGEDIGAVAERAYSGTLQNGAHRDRAIRRNRTALRQYLLEVQERGFKGATARTEALLEDYGLPVGTVGHVAKLWRSEHGIADQLNRGTAPARVTREEFDALALTVGRLQRALGWTDIEADGEGVNDGGAD